MYKKIATYLTLFLIAMMGFLDLDWNNQSMLGGAPQTYAADPCVGPNPPIPCANAENNILGISTEKLRSGNITLNDIPIMIVSVIEFLLGVAGTIAVVALIYHAVRMQIASGITGDSSGVDKAKKGMYGSLLGFVLAMSAWFLMTKLIALLAHTTSGS